MDIVEILEDPRLDLSPESPREQIQAQLSSYLDLLVRWNQKISLTSEKTRREILRRHIFDSLQYARALSPDDRVVDIGSGAGFPGIPLKIIFPRLKMTLVESQRKRCSFLFAVVQNLGLQEMEVVNERAEKILRPPETGVALFRAVSDIKTCLSLAAGFLEDGGRAALKKDPEEKMSPPFEGFSLAGKQEVFGHNNKRSSLLIFEKCFT